MQKMWIRLVASVLGVVAALAFSSGARADFTLNMTETGGPTVIETGTFTPPAGTTFNNVTVGDFLVTVTVKDFQTATQAQLYLQSLSVQNDASSPHTLTLTLTDPNFTMPGASGQTTSVDSQLSASTISAGGSVTFQSFFNGNGVTAGNQTANAPGGFSDATNSFTRGDSFSMQNVTGLNLGPLGNAQETGSTTATATSVIPEPGTFALALAGVVPFCARRWLRRRRSA